VGKARDAKAWNDIDHSLAGLKLTNLAEEMHEYIRKEEARIQFENRGNLNASATIHLILQMKEQCSHDLANKAYAIYCDVWQTQGRKKSASFVRAVYTFGILPILRARANAIAAECGRWASRTGLPLAISNPTLKAFKLRMEQLEDRWRRLLEAEAKECEYIQPEEDLPAVPTAKDQPSGRQGRSSEAKAMTWEAVDISFLSDERVQIRNGNVIETRNYAELGFDDHRNGKPNRSWSFLRALAKYDGIIRDARNMSEDWSKVEKRIQEIRRRLRKHFGISSDPVPFIEGTGYRALFKIRRSRSFDT
jgi:hypothetical protein